MINYCRLINRIDGWTNVKILQHSWNIFLVWKLNELCKCFVNVCVCVLFLFNWTAFFHLALTLSPLSLFQFLCWCCPSLCKSLHFMCCALAGLVVQSWQRSSKCGYFFFRFCTHQSAEQNDQSLLHLSYSRVRIHLSRAFWSLVIAHITLERKATTEKSQKQPIAKCEYWEREKREKKKERKKS